MASGGTALVLFGSGCGSDEPTTDRPEKSSQAPAPIKDEGTGVDEVLACRDRTGQDIAAKTAVPGFVACLKELGAPASVVKAWEP